MSTWAPIICEWQSWAQGGYGIAVFAAGLSFAVAVMIYAKWTGLIPYVVLGALVLYYGVPILEDWFGFAQDCATVRAQFAQEEGYARNTEVCEANLFNVDAQTGEDCGCNGESATPVCQSYYQICSQELQNEQTATNSCSCGFANEEQSTNPVCSQQPAGAVAQVAYHSACTGSNGGWQYGAAYCTSTTIPHAANWIGPVPGADNGYAVGNAYYTEQTIIDNPSQSPITVTWDAESDNSGWYFINGQQVGYSQSWNKLHQYTITLQPGQNTLDVSVWNAPQSSQPPYYGPNPTGTVDEIVGNGGTIYSATGQSDSWYEVSGPPTAPNPPPPASRTNCYTTSCSAP